MSRTIGTEHALARAFLGILTRGATRVLGLYLQYMGQEYLSLLFSGDSRATGNFSRKPAKMV